MSHDAAVIELTKTVKYLMKQNRLLKEEQVRQRELEMEKERKIKEEDGKKMTECEMKKARKKKEIKDVPSPFVISSSEESGEKESEKESERSVKGVKPIKLTGILPYRGDSSFKRWLKKFNHRMNAGSYSDATRLVTLLEYLSPEINDYLAELRPETYSSFTLLTKLLLAEYGHFDPVGGTETVAKLLTVKQQPNECVSVFSARLAAAISDCQEMKLAGTEFAKNCFLDGLLPTIQVRVREVMGDEDDMDDLYNIAKRIEVNILRTKAAARLRESKDEEIILICPICKVNRMTSSKYEMCKECNKGKKSSMSKNNSNQSNNGTPDKSNFGGRRNNNTNTNNNNNNNSKLNNNNNVDSNQVRMCSRCKVRQSNRGYAWCEECYQADLLLSFLILSPHILLTSLLVFLF